jgi:hypothetical protein
MSARRQTEGDAVRGYRLQSETIRVIEPGSHSSGMSHTGAPRGEQRLAAENGTHGDVAPMVGAGEGGCQRVFESGWVHASTNWANISRMGLVNVEAWVCDPCGHTWLKTCRDPERCPRRNCRSRHWDSGQTQTPPNIHVISPIVFNPDFWPPSGPDRRFWGVGCPRGDPVGARGHLFSTSEEKILKISA